MKTVKFKAWDKKNKRWLHADHGGSICVGDGTIVLSHYRPVFNGTYTLDRLEQLTWDRTIEIVEFTGLRDKKGKEIFEGSIVKCRWKECETGCEEWIAECKPIGKDTFHFYSEFEDIECEIIGNIFEHPELINK